jgi:hypothetical protein
MLSASIDCLTSDKDETETVRRFAVCVASHDLIVQTHKHVSHSGGSLHPSYAAASVAFMGLNFFHYL